MEASHTASLSLDFGRELRDLINSEEYRRIFSVTLAPDCPGRLALEHQCGRPVFRRGKERRRGGARRRSDYHDDPHSEQAVIENSKEEFKKTWAWYLAGPRQPFNPEEASSSS